MAKTFIEDFVWKCFSVRNSKDKIQKFDLVTILKSSYSKFRQKNPLKKVGYAPTLTHARRALLFVVSPEHFSSRKSSILPIKLSPLSRKVA
jgi:hypothetical protein